MSSQGFYLCRRYFCILFSKLEKGKLFSFKHESNRTIAQVIKLHPISLNIIKNKEVVQRNKTNISSQMTSMGKLNQNIMNHVLKIWTIQSSERLTRIYTCKVASKLTVLQTYNVPLSLIAWSFLTLVFLWEETAEFCHQSI